MQRNFFQRPSANPKHECGQLVLGTIIKDIPLRKMPGRDQLFMYFKLNDHADLVEEGARLIAERIQSLNLNNPYFVTPEASTIALAHVLRTKYGIDGLMIYKNKQINDDKPVTVEYDVVTATDKKMLHLDINKAAQFKNRDIVILDSVCTRGGTLRATHELLVKAGINPERIKEAIVLFTEEERRNCLTLNNGTPLPVHSFGHLDVVELNVKQSPRFDIKN